MAENEVGRGVSAAILDAYVRSVEARGLSVVNVAVEDLREALARRRAEKRGQSEGVNTVSVPEAPDANILVYEIPGLGKLSYDQVERTATSPLKEVNVRLTPTDGLVLCTLMRNPFGAVGVEDFEVDHPMTLSAFRVRVSGLRRALGDENDVDGPANNTKKNENFRLIHTADNGRYSLNPRMGRESRE